MAASGGASSSFPSSKSPRMKRASSLRKLPRLMEDDTPPALPPRFCTLGHETTLVNPSSPLWLSPTASQVSPSSSNRLFGSPQMKDAVKRSFSMTALNSVTNEPMEIADFVAKYSNHLPVRVNVLDGYCTVSDIFVSQHDHLYLHFVKHSKVVVLSGTECLEQYSVPLYSSLQFGILFDPRKNEEDAIAGRFFKTVGDIISLKTLPTVMCATQDYKGSNPSASVEAGELLVVKSVKSSGFPGRGKVLKVCSVKHGNKRLSEKCAGLFSTRPDDVKMPVSVMLEQSIRLPQKVMLFASQKVRSFLPTSMRRRPVLLEKIKGETTVIATGVNATASDYESGPLLDISSEVSVKVEMVTLSEEEKTCLLENTNTVYDTYEAGRLQPLIEMPCSRAFDLQMLIYNKVARGRKLDGIHLVWPTVMHLQSLSPRGRSVTDVTSDLVQSNLDTELEGDLRKTKRSASEPYTSHYRLRDCGSSSSSESSVTFGVVKDYSPTDFSIVPSQSSPSVDGPCDYAEDTLSETPMPSWFQQHQEGIYQLIGEEDEKGEDRQLAKETHRIVPCISDSEYMTMTPEVNERGVQAEVANLEKRLGSLDACYELLEGHVMLAEQQLDDVCSKVDKLEETVAALNQQGGSARANKGGTSTADSARLRTLEERLKMLEGQVSAHGDIQRPDSGQGQTLSGAEANKALLAGLDCDQVLHILDGMGLPQYKVSFLREQVSGAVLTACTDKELEEELGMAVRIHRIRLLHLVAGKSSVSNFLQV